MLSLFFVLQHVGLAPLSSVHAWTHSWYVSIQDPCIRPAHYSQTTYSKSSSKPVTLHSGLAQTSGHNSHISRGQAGDANEEGRWWSWPKGKYILICLYSYSYVSKSCCHVKTQANDNRSSNFFRRTQKSRLEKIVYSINIYLKTYCVPSFILCIGGDTTVKKKKLTKILPSWYLYSFCGGDKKK